MAVEQTGAACHEIVAGWHDIDWQAVDHNVRRLQARMVKATSGSAGGAKSKLSNAC